MWGYPLGTTIALEPSVSRGGVSATETAQGFIALDVSSAPGNSGGPVVDAEGKVIGILVGSWIAGNQGQTGFKYAAPGIVAATLLADAPAVSVTAQNTVTSRASVASIRPGEGIGGVRLGMTVSQAQQALGLPPTARDANGWYTWETRKIMVLFDNGRALLIGTTSAEEITPEGIRVGATDVDLIRAYGAPVRSSVQSYRGGAYLGWVYEGLYVLLDGSPRRTFALIVIPSGAASSVCR